jgi:hypothetical protein
MSLATPDLHDLDPTTIPDEYERRGLAAVPDDRLFDLIAEVVSEPKTAPSDSFVLHAPLELLARKALLDRVDPARRPGARHRLVELAVAYVGAGEPLRPSSVPLFESAGAATSAIAAALAAGDLDAVDGAAAWLAGRATAADLAPLVDATVASLAAAAHAPLYLYALPRVAPRSRAALGLLRPLAREVARQPSWQIEWMDQHVNDLGHGNVTNALLATPRLGIPGSDFIFPVMHQVDSSGVAAEVLSPVVGSRFDSDAATRAMLRVAAWSMLQDDPAYAPYGWTHCLTLAQAAAGVAPFARQPRRVLAVAATHVVGFRAAMSSGPIVAHYEPDPVPEEPLAALDAAPATAAAAVWHATPADLQRVTTELASRAALHPDAHLAKYTLACFDAAHRDPEQHRLYLAAAAYLAAWWAQSPAA